MAAGSQDSETLSARSGLTAEKAVATGARPSPGVADYLSGEAKGFVRNLQPHLPQELVGGTIPHIPGMEEEAVWNAASQACGTEKVHYCYSVADGKIYYLACPSSTMASNADSWCPLAAALPGNSEYWDHETVYLYEQEGLASALRWDPETGRMQVFLGAARTILPRVQSMDANFVTINAEVADVIPWRNRNLKTEKLARATAKMLVISGVLVTIVMGLVLLFSFLSVNMLERDLSEVKKETQDASQKLILDANAAMRSDVSKHFARIQELLDALAKVEGTLVKYEVKGKSVEWEALVPPAYVETLTRGKINGFSVLEGKSKDGRIRIKGTR